MSFKLRDINASRNIISKSIFTSLWRIFLYILYPWMGFFTIFGITKVASGSMTPSLLTHDIVLVAKYNLSVGDFLSILIPIIGNLFNNPDSVVVKNLPFLIHPIIKFRNIECGDIITFTLPGDPSTYTKRIMAKGGQSLQMFYGRYYVNNKPLKCEYKGQLIVYENNTAIIGDMWQETNNNKTYNIVTTNGMGLISDISDTFYIPENSFFVSGDNRHDSDDGRSMVPYVPESNIKYQIFAVLFSNANLTTLNIEEWWSSIRWQYTLKFTV